MMQNVHNEARELIALGEVVPNEQQAWLRRHIDECEACRRYAEAVDGVVRTLRSLPVAADSRLVRATQVRVRFHASRLREMRERMWLIGIACLGAGLTTTITAPLLWRLFAWMGEWIGVSTLVWQVSFLFFFIVPVLVVALLLLARGTDLIHTREKQWR